MIGWPTSGVWVVAMVVGGGGGEEQEKYAEGLGGGYWGALNEELGMRVCGSEKWLIRNEFLLWEGVNTHVLQSGKHINTRVCVSQATHNLSGDTVSRSTV